ncbi:MAG: hypothetical protein R3E12_14875 [Candidatus Eisenbacteria bacterium]
MEALLSFRGDLYAGGYFRRANGAPFDYLALWDGVAWKDAPLPFDGPVLDLAEFQGSVVAAGSFESAANITVNHIAYLRDGLWETFADGLGGPVSCVTVFEDALYAAGSFTEDGLARPLAHVARWDGSQWQPLSTGTDGPISAMTTFRGELVVGGSFSIAGMLPMPGIAAWDGRDWQLIGTGKLDWISSLAVTNDCLIATGFFHPDEGVAIPGTAYWTGRHWIRLDARFDRNINTTFAHEGRLVVGGDFALLDGEPVSQAFVLDLPLSPEPSIDPTTREGGLLANWDAEDGPPDAPSAWQVPSRGVGSYTQRANIGIAASGARSLEITGNPETSGDFTFWRQTISQNLPIGETVVLEAMIKTAAVWGAGVSIAIRADDTQLPEGDAEAFVSSITTIRIADTHDWTLYRIALPELPEGMKSLTAYLIMNSITGGSAYFDRISMYAP